MKSRLRISDSEVNQQSLAQSTIDQAANLFSQHGALWLENALPKEFVANLRAAYSAKYSSCGQRKLASKFARVGDQRFMISVKIKGVFNSPLLYANPNLMPILSRTLGPDFVISSFGSVVAFPGAEDQPIHFDHPPLFQSEQACSDLPAHAITVVIPLVDIDRETGSTGIWEGSHRSGGRAKLNELMEKPSWEGAALPLPRAGDAYLMDYRVIHGGMANHSQTIRPIFYIVYSRPWFNDYSNFSDQLAIRLSKKQRKKIPKQHRRLFLKN
jgi:ectoine hydroxylase-related dioxygenase (phytanoyl-CoA dioxygenase family)